MSKQLILVSSITYAIKGRDILRSRGYKAYIERTPSHLDRVGCGYSIYVNGDVEGAEAVLRANRIRVFGRSEGSDNDIS